MRVSHPCLIASLALAFAACSSSHDRDDEDMGVRRDGSIVIQSDARIVSCASALSESAFVPDSLSLAGNGGWIPSVRPQVQFGLAHPGGGNDYPQNEPSEGAPYQDEPGAVPDVDDRAGNCGGDPFSGYAWDGHRCRRVLRSYCESGGACSDLYADLNTCESEHATCEPALCRNTGGMWTEFAVSCARPECGHLPISECDGPTSAQCVCPANQTFGEQGCQADAACGRQAAMHACLHAGGIWDPAALVPYFCGAPAINNGFDAAPPREDGQCNCGPGRNFDIAQGTCVQANCGDVQQDLCVWSGGTWESSICGSTVCGVYSTLECASGGCDCGAQSIFDPLAGCVLAPYCRTNMCF